MAKEEFKKEAEEKYNERLKQNGYKIEYRNETYIDGYIDSAEPREKRIAELEAEVKEWKDKANLWCKTANLKDHNIMINKELEKENAELKTNFKIAKDNEYEYSSLLIKAKELLRKVMFLKTLNQKTLN